MSDRFYQKILLEHFKNPYHKKKVENPDFVSGKYNPSCGDRVKIAGLLKDGVITDIGFEGSGCVISQASTSLLAQSCMGKSVDEIRKLTKESILKMIGLQLGPNRLRCALLPLEALHEAILALREKD